MKLVVQPAAKDYIAERGGTVYVWAKRIGCCRGRGYVLESATEPPEREFELVHAAAGFRLYTSLGLIQPDRLDLELSRRGRLEAYWNGQGWIG